MCNRVHRQLQEKILHDPTRILDIFQELLCNVESVAELCLVCYNLHMHVVTSELNVVRDVSNDPLDAGNIKSMDMGT